MKSFDVSFSFIFSYMKMKAHDLRRLFSLAPLESPWQMFPNLPRRVGDCQDAPPPTAKLKPVKSMKSLMRPAASVFVTTT